MDAATPYAELEIALHRQQADDAELDPQALGKTFLDRVVEVHLEDEDDPYRILADLDSEVYVSASAETLLLNALEQRQRSPEHLFCRWRSTEKEHPKAPERQHDGEPTRDRPVVYQVFGTFRGDRPADGLGRRASTRCGRCATSRAGLPGSSGRHRRAHP